MINFLKILLICFFCSLGYTQAQVKTLRAGFQHPPDSAKPGVYWYFMDGNMSSKSITEDLEAMKKAGIGNLIFLEVNVGIPRGPVDFLSDKWISLFVFAEKEARRLGIEITLGIGPGWTGSGGPWVKPDQSMQQLVSSEVIVIAGDKRKIVLPVPLPKKPFFGEDDLPEKFRKDRSAYYNDVAVLAFPAANRSQKIVNFEEKALYYRAPFSSGTVKPYLTPSVVAPEKSNVIDKDGILDITDKMQPDGTLNWSAPPGEWTVMRFASRNNGAITRPAPIPGLGFESDKFDTTALNAHLEAYVGMLLKKTGPPTPGNGGGLKRLHMDSWEMGAQNWSEHFKEEFIKRRGYNPLKYFPVYAGNVVGNIEESERFLWDLRQTAQELVLENHAGHVKAYAHQHQLTLSIEPYDMNPTADLELGNIADIPMAEFWNRGYGFNSVYSVIESTSIGHVNGKSLIPAESFTSQNNEGWKQYPGAMKNQGDWAFASGINRFVYHTFQNQFLPDSLRPGATMGPYGVHWDRNQTWWPLVSSYHKYISRCQYMLQQGHAVADILYLTPEGSPHVFRPPVSAMNGDTLMPDRKGYNFDGCSPGQLFKASVDEGKIVFPGGASYRLLVLPGLKTMTPALLKKITSLVNDGATIIGMPPSKSPGLSGYPACDAEVSKLSKALWGDTIQPVEQITHIHGKGKIVWGGACYDIKDGLYPNYDVTAGILKSMHIPEDFVANGELRYTHRRTEKEDIYFVSNRTDKKVTVNAMFRSVKGNPQIWDAINGNIRNLPQHSLTDAGTSIPLELAAYQSFFVIFGGTGKISRANVKNYPTDKIIKTLSGPWQVSFDPKWGGPEHIVFDKLTDWTSRPENGIKYYSGTAVYHQEFDLPKNLTGAALTHLSIDLSAVNNMARLKLNGKIMGIIWTAPWAVDISNAVLMKHNKLEIEVINLWPNRLIGDERLPDDGIKNNKWPDWLNKGTPRTSGRYTFSSYKFYGKDSPLLKSGLVGPVTIKMSTFN